MLEMLSHVTSELRRLGKQRLALIGGGVLASAVLVALLAPLLAPHDPLAQNLYARLQPPSASHWLGTDDFGRDIFSRIVYGARISLRIGLVAIALAASAGTLLGLIAGYRGGIPAGTLLTMPFSPSASFWCHNLPASCG